MNITVEELAMLLGQKDMEIFVLQKQLQGALARVAELEPKPEAQPELKVAP